MVLDLHSNVGDVPVVAIGLKKETDWRGEIENQEKL